MEVLLSLEGKNFFRIDLNKIGITVFVFWYILIVVTKHGKSALMLLSDANVVRRTWQSIHFSCVV